MVLAWQPRECIHSGLRSIKHLRDRAITHKAKIKNLNFQNHRVFI